MLNGLIRKPVSEELLLLKKAIWEDKQYLASTDYKAIKYAEGEYTDEEYEEVKQARKAARSRIRSNESKLVSFYSNRDN